jgi:predicted PurR-regulated permease PerM
MTPATLFKKTQALTMALCAFLALIILIDYGFGGKSFVEEIVSVDTSLQKYYNAGGNSHFSFRIQTANYEVPVSESFASLAEEGQELKVEISPLFGEVNASEILKAGHKEVYSLRLLSGLLLPILTLLVLAIGYRYKEKASTVVFVMEALTVADFIFVLN